MWQIYDGPIVEKVGVYLNWNWKENKWLKEFLSKGCTDIQKRWHHTTSLRKVKQIEVFYAKHLYYISSFRRPTSNN